MAYNFLILALLFLIPGVVIFLLRPDLRRVIIAMSLCSIPFGFTEFLFYPSYWQPKFLFDLADHIGFGIEDIIWVMGLGAFTSTAYAAFSRSTYEPIEALTAWQVAHRSVGLLVVVFLLVAIVGLAGVPMIYGSVAIMIGVTAFICWRRRDLLRPTLLGGLFATGVYCGLSLIFASILPGVFELAWNLEQFSNLYLLGIPLEEILYAFGAGFAATAFYPYVFARRFRPRAASGSGGGGVLD